MIKEVIATGDSVEIAFANACRELGVETIDAGCEILEMPQKKTLGLFGGRPAKVRAYIELVDTEEVSTIVNSSLQQEIDDKSNSDLDKRTEKSTINSIKSSNPLDDVVDYLKNVLTCMGLTDANVSIQKNDFGAALTLSGSDIGFIIGHRGETLDALQYLASLVANHTDGSYFRLTLDVGNYRKKRKETLEALGKKMAYRAIKTGRNSSLEPMNPYERRIIHTAVQDIDGAKSWSEGEDLARHVVIGPEGGEHFKPKQDKYRNRGGYNSGNRGYNKEYRNQKRQKDSQKAGAPRTAGPKLDDPSAPIYGKIEAKK